MPSKQTKNFVLTKKTLMSNRTIMSFLIDHNLSDNAPEKLIRLVGVLTFICLGGTWDENGESKVSKDSSLKKVAGLPDALKNIPYGDIFQGQAMEATKSRRR
jgi:hypothetical protein